jgi:predicted nucleic acid-binding protein
LIAHVAYETTAALSRMPEGHRISPAVVVEWLERRFQSEWLTLPPTAAFRPLRNAVEHGIRGGALYDALIAATAAHHRHTLVTADRRAAPRRARLPSARRDRHLRRRAVAAARPRVVAGGDVQLGRLGAVPVRGSCC